MYILRILDALEKVETKIADLYEWFSEIFSDDAEVSSFFYRISVDESAHANLIRFQRRIISQNRKLAEDIALDFNVVNAVLDRLTSARSGAAPSIEEAIRFAIEIENSVAEAHSQSVIARSIPGISDLLKNLSGFDNRHCEVFVKFAHDRGFSVERELSAYIDKNDIAEGHGSGIGKDSPEMPSEALEEIKYYFERHETMDFYKILGISDHATKDDVKRAYHEMARKFHPDGHMNASQEIQKKLGVIFSSMTNACSTLLDPVRRKQYDISRRG